MQILAINLLNSIIDIIFIFFLKKIIIPAQNFTQPKKLLKS